MQRRSAERYRISALSIWVLSLAALAGCEQHGDRLVIELVPNPEVNTRDHVEAQVNRLDVILDAEGGFEALDAAEGDSWGPYEVIDFDSDGTMELKLTRPGQRALEPFALLEGSQEGRTLHITAMGLDPERNLAALGGSTTRFEGGSGSCELPFNLIPDRRPLRVITMTPPTGSRDLTPPVEGVTIQLGGEVEEDAIAGRVTLVARDFPEAEELKPSLVLSYTDTNMGRLTNIRFASCALTPGSYTIVIDTDVCTITGQCLDQLLGVEGAQPFEGHLHVRGEPSPPDCAVDLAVGSCWDPDCPEGFHCDDDGANCAPDYDAESGAGGVPSCDPELCVRPVGVCHEGTCVPDCAAYGLCPDLSQRCDLETGLCSEP